MDLVYWLVVLFYSVVLAPLITGLVLNKYTEKGSWKYAYVSGLQVGLSAVFVSLFLSVQLRPENSWNQETRWISIALFIGFGLSLGLGAHVATLCAKWSAGESHGKRILKVFCVSILISVVFLVILGAKVNRVVFRPDVPRRIELASLERLQVGQQAQLKFLRDHASVLIRDTKSSKHRVPVVGRTQELGKHSTFALRVKLPGHRLYVHAAYLRRSRPGGGSDSYIPLEQQTIAEEQEYQISVPASGPNDEIMLVMLIAGDLEITSLAEVKRLFTLAPEGRK